MSASSPIPKTMEAVQLVGHGGFEKLVYRRDVPVPQPQRGHVLIKVAATGVNNTDINTRTGWYSKSVAADSGKGGAQGFSDVNEEDSGWSGTPLTFPRIQGADACGHIVAVGEDVSPTRIGERVLVRNMLRSYVDYRPFECWTFGSECDGGFAQYTVAPAQETYAVRCDLSDAELGAVPCAYSTAENMLYRARVGRERVLITGASGGVGSAAVQLAKRRGAAVIAVAAASKFDDVRSLGADIVVDRTKHLVAELGHASIDAVIDVVGGENWGALFDILRKGGRLAIAGAIAGPMAQVDLRPVYLKDLTVFGCTFQDDEVFENLVGYLERHEVKPVVAKTYPLSDIVQAQKDFLSKQHSGKLVLIPPQS